MSDFGMNEMQEMQKALQEKYKQKWEPICPATGQNKLLWMIGEVGEVIDIVKKNGAADAVEKEDLRKHLVEEMADVLMYYNDVMLVRRHIVGGANRTLFSVDLPPRLCRTGT